VVVPPAAVQRGPAGPYVYVVNDDQTVTRRPVGVDHEDLQFAIVTAGLTPRERVVVDGAARLTDHAHVRIAQPPAAVPVAPPLGTPATASRRAGSGAT
jgi:multidrug efflux system membrane fusion protein